MIYCKTPLWIFLLSWLPMSWHCEKFLRFFLDQLSVRWMKEETYQHFNTCYFSNLVESREEIEPTHTSILNGMSSPSTITGIDCSNTTGLLCSKFLCNGTTTLQHSSYLRGPQHWTKGQNQSCSTHKPMGPLWTLAHGFHADALLL